ncbi:hypothetical protein J8273_4927 [Carpediemonas membranifera]|uniref:Uncharacterized protein n=1 Tax=Carpediemonas membranifera TaxID=201153 RepID=A0A8J6BB18_9EUKA|nr:hypothetical protein J8273_4927 [Carpediemonas membranifera]|eukprot:KAG9393627.1 hypothetical protein J8273_4927 [Carpediemonas membranifera]
MERILAEAARIDEAFSFLFTAKNGDDCDSYLRRLVFLRLMAQWYTASILERMGKNAAQQTVLPNNTFFGLTTISRLITSQGMSLTGKRLEQSLTQIRDDALSTLQTKRPTMPSTDCRALLSELSRVIHMTEESTQGETQEYRPSASISESEAEASGKQTVRVKVAGTRKAPKRLKPTPKPKATSQRRAAKHISFRNEDMDPETDSDSDSTFMTTAERRKLASSSAPTRRGRGRPRGARVISDSDSTDDSSEESTQSPRPATGRPESPPTPVMVEEPVHAEIMSTITPGKKRISMMPLIQPSTPTGAARPMIVRSLSSLVTVEDGSTLEAVEDSSARSEYYVPRVERVRVLYGGKMSQG